MFLVDFIRGDQQQVLFAEGLICTEVMNLTKTLKNALTVRNSLIHFSIRYKLSLCDFYLHFTIYQRFLDEANHSHLYRSTFVDSL